MLLSGGTFGNEGIPAANASSIVCGVRSNTTGLAIRIFLLTLALMNSSFSLDLYSLLVSWKTTAACTRKNNVCTPIHR